jgi:hypothetical protein
MGVSTTAVAAMWWVSGGGSCDDFEAVEMAETKGLTLLEG